jgi:hypothetical protein
MNFASQEGQIYTSLPRHSNLEIFDSSLSQPHLEFYPDGVILPDTFRKKDCLPAKGNYQNGRFLPVPVML